MRELETPPSKSKPPPSAEPLVRFRKEMLDWMAMRLALCAQMPGSTSQTAIASAVFIGHTALNDAAVRVFHQDSTATVVIGVERVSRIVVGHGIGNGDIRIGICGWVHVERAANVDAVVQVVVTHAIRDAYIAKAALSDGAGRGGGIRAAADVDSGPPKPAGVDGFDADKFQPHGDGAGVSNIDSGAPVPGSAGSLHHQVANHDPAKILHEDSGSGSRGYSRAGRSVGANRNGTPDGAPATLIQHQIAMEAVACVKQDTVAGREAHGIDFFNAAPGPFQGSGVAVVSAGADIVRTRPCSIQKDGKRGGKQQSGAEVIHLVPQNTILAAN